MSKHDYHTSTVDGARAWAERHAEPHYDDRPTNAELAAEEAIEELAVRRAEALAKARDAIDELWLIDEDAAIQIDNLIDDLEKNP